MPLELPIPPEAAADDHSLEMIRVWLADGKQHCVLNIGFWEERGIDECHAWGILLADMLHHIACAHGREYGRDPGETINRVRESLLIEMEHATSDRLGDFVARKQRSRGQGKKGRG
jgi:hypothetical protein